MVSVVGPVGTGPVADSSYLAAFPSPLSLLFELRCLDVLEGDLDGVLGLHS